MAALSAANEIACRFALHSLIDVAAPRSQFCSVARETLRACYGCHKAAGLLPYMRPAVQTEPAQTIINFDGVASWPQ